MCKTKTIKAFNQLWRETVEVSPFLKGDKVAKSEAWAYYIDALCKDGEITLKQYESWTQ